VARKNKNAADGTRPASNNVDQGPKTLVGIEVDGTEIHTAYVEPNGTVRVEHFRDKTPQKALDAALKSIPGRADIVRVAFTGGRQYVRRVEVPRVPERAMRAAMMAVAEENLPIVPGAASVAGLLIGDPSVGRDADDPRGASNEVNMVIAAVESDDLDPVWRRLGGRRAPITSASFLLPADGLYLRVARATSEMIILKGGVPLLARSLRVGGLDELERRIHAGEQAGFAPSGINESENQDAGKSAAEITDNYLDELVGEFRKTLVFWKREGTEVPSDIIVLGAGATIPTLLTRVRDAGFNISPVPEPRGVHMAMADHEKPVAFQALAAAYSDFSQQPYAILPNPVYDQQKVIAKRKAKQRLMVFIGLIAVGSILFLSLAPLAYAKSREALATRGLKSEEKKIEKLLPLIEANAKLQQGEAAVEVIKTGTPAYTRVICSVDTSKPVVDGRPTQFKTMAITTTELGPSVDITVQVPNSAAGFQVIGDWQVKLEKTISAKKIGVGSFKLNQESNTIDGSYRWTAPLKSAFLVPNIGSCDGYVDGLSDTQIRKIDNGFDANDETVTFDANGRLISASTGEPVKSKATTTTTTTVPEDTDTTTTDVTTTTQGGE
jgi:hypothetical protein